MAREVLGPLHVNAYQARARQFCLVKPATPDSRVLPARRDLGLWSPPPALKGFRRLAARGKESGMAAAASQSSGRHDAHVSSHVFEVAPQIEIAPASAPTEERPQECCTICIEDFAQGERHLSCPTCTMHAHAGCLRRWFGQALARDGKEGVPKHRSIASCPNCRAGLDWDALTVTAQIQQRRQQKEQAQGTAARAAAPDLWSRSAYSPYSLAHSTTPLTPCSPRTPSFAPLLTRLLTRYSLQTTHPPLHPLI